VTSTPTLDKMAATFSLPGSTTSPAAGTTAVVGMESLPAAEREELEAKTAAKREESLKMLRPKKGKR